jgi:hypothetical protein
MLAVIVSWSFHLEIDFAVNKVHDVAADPDFFAILAQMDTAGALEGRLSMKLVKSFLFFLCRLAHFLSSNIRQVVVLIVGFIISPHDENNFQPFGAQGS